MKRKVKNIILNILDKLLIPGTIIPMGVGGNVMFSKIKVSKKNRKIMEKQVDTINKSVKKLPGMVRGFTIFPDGELADASHLSQIDELQKAYEKYGDFPVPVIILNWVDPNDEKLKQRIIILLQNNVKKWNVKDFVRVWESTLGGDYTILKQEIKDWEKIDASPSIVVAFYTKKDRTNVGDPVKNGTFVIDNSKKEVETREIVMEFFRDLYSSVKKKRGGNPQYKKLPNGTLRTIAQYSLNLADTINDNEKLKYILMAGKPRLVQDAKDDRIPSTKTQMEEWWIENIVEPGKELWNEMKSNKAA